MAGSIVGLAVVEEKDCCLGDSFAPIECVCDRDGWDQKLVARRCVGLIMMRDCHLGCSEVAQPNKRALGIDAMGVVPVVGRIYPSTSLCFEPVDPNPGDGDDLVASEGRSARLSNVPMGYDCFDRRAKIRLDVAHLENQKHSQSHRVNWFVATRKMSEAENLGMIAFRVVLQEDHR